MPLKINSLIDVGCGTGDLSYDASKILNKSIGIDFSKEMIKLVKPKWHENKYLWFFGGILITSGSVYLAGQIK